MLAVAVEHHDGRTPEFPGPGKPSHHRLRLATILLKPDHLGAGEPGDLGGPVGRAVVDDDDPVGVLPGLEDDRADHQPLVVGRDNGGEPGLGGGGSMDALRAGEGLGVGGRVHGMPGCFGLVKSPGERSDAPGEVGGDPGGVDVV